MRRVRSLLATASVSLLVLTAAMACGSFGETPAQVVADGDVPDVAPADAPSGDLDGGPSRADGSFCATVKGFCDDFERGTVTSAEWSPFNAPSLAIDDTVSASPTRSLRAIIPPSGGQTSATLARAFNPAARKVQASFAMRIDELPVNDAEFGAFEFANKRFVFLIGNAGSGFRIAEQDLNQPQGTPQGYKDTLLERPASGKFVPYAIEIDLDAHTARITAGGNASVFPLSFGQAPPCTFRLGIPYTAAQPKTTPVWFDDVVIP